MLYFLLEQCFGLNKPHTHTQTQDDDWNHDTDLRYNDPEPDEVFIRKTSNPKPRREPKKAALPEWQSTADDEDVGFGAPPPLRKPAAKKTASRVPKTDRSNGSAPSYGGDAGGGGGGGCLVNLDDMPVGGGGGGKQPKLPSSRIPSFAKKAAKAAPRQAAAAPPAPAYQNDAYDAYGQPDAYGGGGGGLDIDSLPIHAAAGQDNFEQEAMQAANEPQQQCNQVCCPHRNPSHTPPHHSADVPSGQASSSSMQQSAGAKSRAASSTQASSGSSPTRRT